MNVKQTLVAGALLGFLSVAIGAFGAHAMKSTLEANGRIDTFELAVRYQFFHALALLFLGLWMSSPASTTSAWVGPLWLGGVVLFSGSLYMLAITNIKAFAMATPIGGLMLLAGWGVMLWEFVKSK